MSLQEKFGKLEAHLKRLVVGQDRLLNRMLVALLSDGHLLVEGAPGLAKTRAIKVLSHSVEGDFHRLQFTPDLLPADLTGTEIYRPQDGTFVYESVPEGDATIVVIADGLAPAFQVVRGIRENQTSRCLPFDLTNGAIIEGTVLDPDGSPAAGCGIGIGDNWRAELPPTNSRGQFWIKGLPAGPVRVWLIHRGLPIQSAIVAVRSSHHSIIFVGGSVPAIESARTRLNSPVTAVRTASMSPLLWMTKSDAGARSSQGR